MPQLRLSSVSSNEYLISGDYEELLNNSRAKLALKKLTYHCDVDGLHVESSDRIDYVVKILRLAAKFIRAEVVFDDETNDEILDFQAREKAFALFSQEAQHIKDDQFQSEQFLEFSNSLVNNMANRRLYKLQLLAAYHLAFSQNGCNFSVPGAGKTSIVYGAYAYLKNLPDDNIKHIDKLLIIGPLSSFVNMKNVLAGKQIARD